MAEPAGVGAAIRAALLTETTRERVMAARRIARDWRQGRLAFTFVPLPDCPRRPAAPPLVPASRLPRRGRGQSPRARIALWHALAHIEFVAIDLALDMAGRFGAVAGAQFTGDFLAIAAEEAMHFALIDRHLAALGSHYGALPAHDGLWQAALETRHDLAARLAVVPLVLEARGLDVTPSMLARARASGDARGARILQRILDDEIRHVATGAKHFLAHCERTRKTPGPEWRMLVTGHFRGSLKPPFNDSARQAAGLPREWYAALAS
ncbi:MAG: ferritin-like domain-containing protein [Sphingomonadales bacterium]|nr:ferritin-like domain-containing protein [Sphingomonadales bacterium]